MPSNGVLKLGKKIVDELGLDQTVDTLSRWMAHYVVEKIGDVNAATGENRAQKMSACADAIFKLWAHRSNLPNGKRPFEDFEPIFRALQSLDPDDATPRYFRQIRSAADEKDESAETTQWLRIASGLDYTARILIRYCLATAAGTSVDKDKEWIALANAAGRGDDIDVRIVRILIDDAKTLDPKTPEDLEREEIKDLLKKLEGFSELANMLSMHLSNTLRAMGEITPQVLQLLHVLKEEMGRDTLQSALALKTTKNFRLHYLLPALDAGLIEVTIPDKPRSRKQRYRLTDKGRQLVENAGGAP